MMKYIKIADDFSVAPGGRYRHEGDFSGEEFRESILEPSYIECVKNGEKLTIDMDGCFGFAPSFLEESFGGLARDMNSTDILKNIVIIHNDEPGLLERIRMYVEKALSRK